MSEGPRPSSEPNHLQKRLDHLVGTARLALWWEEAWPRLWLPLSVIAAFLTVSFFGLWIETPPLWHAVGLALFGLAPGGCVLARIAALPATPRASPRPPRPRRRRRAWAGPGPRRYPGARKQRCRDPGLVGPASPTGGNRPRVHAGHAPPAGHAAAGPLCGAGRRDPGPGGQRFRGGPRGLAPPGRRLRLANRPGGGARLPGRRLDRPAPLYAHSAADDRSRGGGAAPARAREVDGRGSGGRPGRRHHHGGTGPHGPAGAAQPAGRPA